jgi:hypothetical protein
MPRQADVEKTCGHGEEPRTQVHLGSVAVGPSRRYSSQVRPEADHDEANHLRAQLAVRGEAPRQESLGGLWQLVAAAQKENAFCQNVDHDLKNN